VSVDHDISTNENQDQFYNYELWYVQGSNISYRKIK